MTDIDIKQLETMGFSDEQLATYATVYRDDLLQGKLALISGSGAVARATAYLFARLGAEIMICSSKEETLNVTASGIKKHLGRDIHSFTLNTRHAEAVDDLMQRLWQQFGRVDILLNCDTHTSVPQSAIDLSIDEWKDTIETRLNGAWYMMQKAAKYWRDQQQAGCIVNVVADIWRGMPGVVQESAVGAGLVFAGRSLAVEWAPHNIRVNAIAASAIDRVSSPYEDPTSFDGQTCENPMLHGGDVMDIAEALVYLAAPSGKFITGECLTVDGGQQLWGEVWANGKPEYFETP